MTLSIPTHCLLCGAKSNLLHHKHHGYKAPDMYEIVTCPLCNTACAFPHEIDEAVYDLIYINARTVPGYDRYFEYLNEVKVQTDPLRYLADQEDTYDVIQQHIESNKFDRSGKILEVGSGFGYLTFALSRRGFDVLGIDVSARAIESAKREFGDLYRCANLFDLTPSPENCYQTIIMTEVIEHVPDFVALLQHAIGLLSKGGSLVLTTPNKSLYDAPTVWETDAPPIHLWWLSEQSIQIVAKKLNCGLTFTDFTMRNKTKQLRIHSAPYPITTPIFLENGEVINPPSSYRRYRKAKNLLRKTGIQPYSSIFMRWFRGLTNRLNKIPFSSRSNTLGIILTPRV